MCQSQKCSKRDSCYRFLATPNPNYQSYMNFPNICSEQNNWRWYWEIKQEAVDKKEGENNKEKNNDA